MLVKGKDIHGVVYNNTNNLRIEWLEQCYNL